MTAATEMPLWAAAVLAYREVLSIRGRDDQRPSNNELDLVALVLSGYVPIYGARQAGGGQTRLRESELAQACSGVARAVSSKDPTPSLLPAW